MKTKFRKKHLFFFISIALVSMGILSQESLDWIGSYSSKELENSPASEKEKKVYYYWQIQSLKRAIAPRYIRVLDIAEYGRSGSFLSKGVLFTYQGIKNNEVEICGNFTSWRCIPMQRNRYGVYYKIVRSGLEDRNENKISKLSYKFRIDGIFDYDPSNPKREEDGKGSFYSIYQMEQEDFEKNITYRIIDREIDDDIDFKTVEFRIYSPHSNTVAIVGDFNQWNPEHDYLVKSDDGIFRLRKKLKPGDYLYYYIIDGKPSLDTFNHETRYREETEELCSYVSVPSRKLYDTIAKE